MIATLDRAIEGIGPRGVGQRLELVEREIGFLQGLTTERGADEDRFLSFGPGLVKLRQLTAFLNRSTPSSSRSSSRVRENRT